MADTDIKRFLNEEGKITVLPSKQKFRTAVLEYLADKFEYDRIYREKDINGICDAWHTFDDFYLMRRELIDYGFLARKKDGSEYWRIKKAPEEAPD